MKSKNFKWTFDMCREEALKYNSRIDFKNNSKGAYPSCLKNKWLDEVCKHMEPLGNKYKRLIYVCEFDNNYCYIGLTYNFKKRKYQHLHSNESPIFKHIEKYNLTPKFTKLTNLLNIKEAKNKEIYFIKKYIQNGFIVLNKAKGGALGSNNIKWTYDNCKKEALKYKTTKQLKINSPTVYNKILKNKWLELIKHLHNYTKPNGYWTYDNCKKEALKYNTRYEYYLNESGSHESARKNNWLDDICSHMIELKKPKNYWDKKNCISELNKYNNNMEILKKHNKYVFNKINKYKWQII